MLWAASHSCMTSFATSPAPYEHVLAARLLPTPVLTFVTPPWDPMDDSLLLSKVKDSARGGATMVQIRDKSATSEVRRCVEDLTAMYEIGKACVEGIADIPCRLLTNINRETDIRAAVRCGAHGIHLPERFLDRLPGLIDQLTAERGEASLGSAARPAVGASVHSVTAAIKAARLGVSYIQVGTMFPTASHPEKADDVEGPALMQEVCTVLKEEGLRGRVSVIGIGGIDEKNCGEVMRAGADGVAVIGALANAPDPAVRAAMILDAMRRA